MMTADQIIHQFNLAPHPEGGHYREVYRSSSNLISPVNGQERHAVTQIYFLLKAGEKSRFHRVLHDEIWHLYAGDALRLITFDGQATEEVALTPDLNGEFVHVVPGGTFQAAESYGDFSFVGCTVAPGFDFEDFCFLSDHPDVSKSLPEDYREFV